MWNLKTEVPILWNILTPHSETAAPDTWDGTFQWCGELWMRMESIDQVWPCNKESKISSWHRTAWDDSFLLYFLPMPSLHCICEILCMSNIRVRLLVSTVHKLSSHKLSSRDEKIQGIAVIRTRDSRVGSKNATSVLRERAKLPTLT